MNSQQRQRFNKVWSEEFYLLDKKSEKANYIFQISGSTANIYTVTIYGNAKRINCDCPDSWARTSKCICKHCCFILFKVLKAFDPNQTDFWKERLFAKDEINKIKDKFQKINFQDAEIVDTELLEKYQELKGEKVEKKENKYQQQKKLEEDDVCPICYIEFDDEKNIECPTCHGVIHQTCMEKWLQMGKTSCVYCRSEVWKNYGKKMGGGEGEYKNLLV